MKSIRLRDLYFSAVHLVRQYFLSISRGSKESLKKSSSSSSLSLHDAIFAKLKVQTLNVRIGKEKSDHIARPKKITDILLSCTTFNFSLTETPLVRLFEKIQGNT